MTLWFINRLFETEGQKAERERLAEKKRREKIRRRRELGKKRQLELDQLRKAAGGVSEEKPPAEMHEQYAYNRSQPPKATLGGTAMNAAFGSGPPHSQSGYKHGHHVDSANPCQIKVGHVARDDQNRFLKNVGKVRRPF